MCCVITAPRRSMAAGMDLKALQELLGHQWLATTSGYIHVRDDHVEQAWVERQPPPGNPQLAEGE